MAVICKPIIRARGTDPTPIGRIHIPCSAFLVSDRIFSHSPSRRVAFPYYSKINSGHEYRGGGGGRVRNPGDEVWQVSDTRQPFQKRDVTLPEIVHSGQRRASLLEIVREL